MTSAITLFDYIHLSISFNSVVTFSVYNILRRFKGEISRFLCPIFNVSMRVTCGNFATIFDSKKLNR